jgi:hypothetical protein
LDEIGALTPKYPPNKTYALTYLEIALAEFWGEGMGTQPGAPDGDMYIYIYVPHLRGSMRLGFTKKNDV